MHKDMQELWDLIQTRMRVNKEYKQISQDHLFLDGPVPYLGNQSYLNKMMQIIQTSEGSSTLITGFGTVGKSALAINAVDQLNRKNAQVTSTKKYINVNIKAIRVAGVEHVLKMIIQQLYYAMRNHPVWDEMAPELRNSLKQINMRLFATISEVNGSNSELKLNVVSQDNDKNGLTAGMGTKNEQTYAYEKLDVTEMIMYINQFLKDFRKARSFYRVVIIIEELDKLPNNEKGFQFLEALLSEMKELICSPNAHYILIGGISIHRWMLNNRHKIDDVAHNLFQNQIYLPCLVGSVDELFKVIEDKGKIYLPIPKEYQHMVEKKCSDKLRGPFHLIGQYLLFRGTGLPGRILRCFHEFIGLNNKGQHFVLSKEQILDICCTLSVMEHFSGHLEEINNMNGFDRDIHFFIFTSILGYFKSYQDRKVTKQELWDAIVPKVFNDNDFYSKIFEAELKYLTSSGGSGKNKIGILKKDKGKYQLKVNLFSDAADPCADDPAQLFRDCVASMQSEEARQFLSRYTPVQIISRTNRDVVFEVQLKGSNLLYDMRFYMTKSNFDWFPKAKMVVHPCLRDTVYVSESGRVSAAIYEKETGIPLDQLIGAKLRNQMILQIMDQLLSLIDTLHGEGYTNINLSPENILVCADGRIQLRRLENRLERSNKIVPLTVSPYSAPEVYLNLPCEASDYYFAALLFLAMFHAEDLRRSVYSRHIYVEDLSLRTEGVISALLEVLGKGKMRPFLTEATKASTVERLADTATFTKKMHKCLSTNGSGSAGIPAICAGVKGCVQVKIFKAGSKGSGQKVGQAFSVSQGEQDPKETVCQTGNVSSGNGPAKAARTRNPHLIRLQTAERINISATMLRVGRDGDMDLRLFGSRIGRVHADLMTIGSRVRIYNYNHSQTYLNNKLLETDKEYVINDGDRIRFGDEDEFEFHETETH